MTQARLAWTLSGRTTCRNVFSFASRRRHTRLVSDWSSDVCSSDLQLILAARPAGGRGRLRTPTSKDQLHDPTARLKRVAHPLRRANSITHPGLLAEVGLGRPQASPEARTRSVVSKVCSQST